MSEQNKLIKMVTDSAVLVGLTAGVGYLAKKIFKENFLRQITNFSPRKFSKKIFSATRPQTL